MGGRGGIAEFRHAGATTARLFNFDVAQDRLKPEHETWLVANVLGRLRGGGSIWIMGLTSTTGLSLSTINYQSGVQKRSFNPKGPARKRIPV